VRDFRRLLVWEKSHRLTLDVYKFSGSFPRSELYGLTSQIRRASVSISANIVEGCGRSSQTDFARFLHIAMGSASELQYHLLLAHELDFLKPQIYGRLNSQVIEVKRMLTGLITQLTRKASKPKADP
jgi:four helix bundle protein